MKYLKDSKDNFSYVKRCLRLLNSLSRLKYFIITIFQILISAFDILGIVLFGILLKIVFDFNQAGYFKIDFFLFQIEFEPKSYHVLTFGILILILLILKSFLNLFFSYKLNNFLGTLQYKISMDFLNKFLNSNISLITKRNSSTYTYVVNNGYYLTITSTLSSFSILLSETFLFFVIFALLTYYNFYIAIFVFLYLFIVGLYIQFLLNGKFTVVGEQFANSIPHVQNFMTEIIKGFREISVYNKQKIFYKFIDSKLQFGILARAKSNFFIGIPKSLYEIFLIIGIFIFSIWTFTNFSFSTAISLVGVFLISISRLVPTLLRINNSFLSITKNKAESGDFFEILCDFENFYQNKISINVPTTYRANKLFIPRIEIRNLNFGYQGGELLLENVNLFVEPQEKVAIIGSSGSGKSTFFDLILGFQEPISGNILINGLPTLTANRNWYGAIAYVPQEPFLLNASLKKNISLEIDESKIDILKITEILKELKLYDYFIQLPFGLDTEINENGFNLSGGQKHRLGLARALYSNPELLFLDEATSSLDEETEKIINDYIYSNLSGKTVLTIAHKLTTIKYSEKIYRLENRNLTLVK